MSSAAPGRRRATVEDLLAIPEAERFHEIVDGELVHKALSSPRHGAAQAELTTEIAGAPHPTLHAGKRSAPGRRWQACRLRAARESSMSTGRCLRPALRP
ncbi:uncharacterized protein SOCE26_062090 [Sorangium cellulosum]|uniref:Restriction endonuclease domain-containing protein n=1 Tax=Sorangium cellulosum TaxID=56 RepID=A0A2L0EZK9_SORCE|nr:uncharacterized protein SOCE26_062090 [Sorangium cellulosum]